MLKKFVAAYRDGHAGLSATSPADPAAAWRAASHSLRGACAAVEVTGLPERLLDFEGALKSPGDPAALGAVAHAIHGELRDVVRRLASVIDSTH